jgi:hypothetical protein
VALFRKRERPGQLRQATSSDERDLEAFARSHRGVEAFIEPKTTVTETTMLLVADTGEWTRRRIAGPEDARALARKLGIPAYDAGLVGYPQRMRDWNDRKRREARGET